MTIDPELVERFRADLSSLWPQALDRGAKIGVALSGGPDSLALLILGQAAFPDRVEAATVDHGLRPESAEEARSAASICASLEVPHQTFRIQVADGNVQDQARRARYSVFSDWAKQRGIDAVCTGHHAEDQAETIMMRLNRGSGMSGLAGIRACGTMPDSTTILLRPLLGWKRATLKQVVLASGFQAAQDPSNIDTRFDRVRMRQALEQSDWIDIQGVARSAQVLASMEDSILGLVAEDLDLSGRHDGSTFSYRPFASSSVYRPSFWGEVIVMIYDEIGKSITRRDAVRMATLLSDGQSINIGGIQAFPEDENGTAIWRFGPENPRSTS